MNVFDIKTQESLSRVLRQMSCLWGNSVQACMGTSA